MTSREHIVDLAFDFSRLLKRMETEGGCLAVNMLRSQALALLEEKPDLTMKELARSLRVSASTATSFADRLVELGWIKRVQNAKNRKLVHLRLTKKGEKVSRDSVRERRKFLERVFGLIAKQDRDQLERILRDLVETMRAQSSFLPTSSSSHVRPSR